MTTPELRASWDVTARHLTDSRSFLPAGLSIAEADAIWAPVQEFLKHNELGLALEEAIDLGEECNAPREYWQELLLAATNMGLTEHSARIRARL